MKRLFFIFISILLISLTACSTVNQTQSWPEAMPPKAYFVDYYNKDPEHQKVLSLDSYLRWIKRFYLGWELYRQGWLKVAHKLPQTVPPEEQAEVKSKVLEIGRLVSPEWAKNQRYRVIHTQHLGIWGNAINESITRSEQNQLLDRIHKDVLALLDKEITPKDITEDRYYEIEMFGGNF